MSDIINLSRRAFVKAGLGLSGGLILGCYLPGESEAAVSAASFAPNAFVRIGSDDTVTFILGKTEMGQGVYTSVPMLIAEELEVDLGSVRIEPSPVDPAYNNPVFGMQLTGGSTSIASCWEPLRKAGASARIMLIAAGAQTWGVAPAACHADSGSVIHTASSRRLSYGRLAEKASRLSPPGDVKLKDPREFKLIGKPTKRLEGREKVTGKAIFGIDVNVPGMLTAVVARPPMVGGQLAKFSPEKARSVQGVRAVVQTDFGIAVVADGFWPAKNGRDALAITWEDGPMAKFSTLSQRTEYIARLDQAGILSQQKGDVVTAMNRATKKLEATYEVPYVAHATMEPINCVADVRADRCEIWAGTQFQTLDRDAASKAAGLKPVQVHLHTTFAGGGFGRRGSPDADFVRTAVHISKAVNAPVKVIWTREDDIQGGYYRPAYCDAISGGLDSAGMPISWSHKIVGQSVLLGTPFESLVPNEGQSDSVDGAIDLPYDIPNLYVNVRNVRSGPKVWAWRSVGASHTAFVVESFLDELAGAARKDPVEFRRALLTNSPRHKAVLDLAAEKAGWGKPLPSGQGRGIALHQFGGSVVAHVAEASVVNEGKVRVHRVVSAVDCGLVVNPDSVRAQMEGGIAFGLSAALYEEITFERGRVQQSNFDDYPILRMDAMPTVEVHLVPSTTAPRGVGEAPVPPIAPAVANAIFAVTGKRIRRLPIRLGAQST